jgi:hypothetical protein
LPNSTFQGRGLDRGLGPGLSDHGKKEKRHWPMFVIWKQSGQRSQVRFMPGCLIGSIIFSIVLTILINVLIRIL